MMDKSQNGMAAEPSARPGKKLYQTPQLTVHGRVDEITQLLLKIGSNPKP